MSNYSINLIFIMGTLAFLYKKYKDEGVFKTYNKKYYYSETDYEESSYSEYVSESEYESESDSESELESGSESVESSYSIPNSQKYKESDSINSKQKQYKIIDKNINNLLRIKNIINNSI